MLAGAVHEPARLVGVIFKVFSADDNVTSASSLFLPTTFTLTAILSPLYLLPSTVNTWSSLIDTPAIGALSIANLMEAPALSALPSTVA